MTLVSETDFEVLGIGAGEWALCLADTRLLPFDDWRALWAPTKPARIATHMWERTAHSVYRTGPLSFYLAVHGN